MTADGRLEDWIFEQTGGIVQSGPFKDMKMARERAWVMGALSPMLLGCHEQELWVPIEEEIARLASMAIPCIVNLGCAEGYYAVGLKRRLPHATVWGVDISRYALDVTLKAAAQNDVEVAVTDDVEEAFAEPPDLILSDCEGAEVSLLDPVKFPKIAAATSIVEMHQLVRQETSTVDIVFNAWSGTHNVYWVFEGGRNPNDYPMLRSRPSLMRWMAVCEDRAVQMLWFVMRPK